MKGFNRSYWQACFDTVCFFFLGGGFGGLLWYGSLRLRFLPEAVRNFPEALLESLDLKIVSPELFEGEDGRLVRRLLDYLGLRVLSPEALVLEGVMPLLEKLGDSPGPEEVRTVSLCVAYLASVRMSNCADGWARKFKRMSFESALQKLGQLEDCWYFRVLKQAGTCGRRPGQFPRHGGRGCLSPSTGHI